MLYNSRTMKPKKHGNTEILYPGTFDPITNGHMDLVARAASLFHEVIVAVARNPLKSTLLSPGERVELVELALGSITNARVYEFDGLIADFAHHLDVHVMLRGVRSGSDLENELQRASVNRLLNPRLDTILMTPGEGLAHVSSSLVRELTLAGGDAGRFVPPAVKAVLDERFRTRRGRTQEGPRY